MDEPQIQNYKKLEAPESYVYCVLTFSRPKYLSDLVTQIHDFDPLSKVLILVDGDPQTNLEITKANIAALECSIRLNSQPYVELIQHSGRNMGTKEALDLLIREGFKYANNVVYIEDDLVLTRSPIPFIKASISFMGANKNVRFATLFSRRVHPLSQTPDDMRISVWPELWGLIISKDNYGQLMAFDSSEVDVETFLNDWHKINYNTLLGKISSSYFTKNWIFKFGKAATSRFAWDTILHRQLWANQGKVILPSKSLVSDRGVDWTSISHTKQDSTPIFCHSKIHSGSGNKFLNGFFICNKCEKIRYIENLALPRKIRTTILMLSQSFSKF